MNILIDPLLFIQELKEATGGIFNHFFLSCSFYPGFIKFFQNRKDNNVV